MRLCMYGAGNTAELFIERKNEQDSIVLLVDSDSEKWGREIYGITIDSPDKINRMQFEKVLICVKEQNTFIEIARDLVNNYNIKEIDIVDVYSLITQRNIRIKQPLIYDCFTFFNECDLLEHRLKYLYDVVDKFVLVEMSRTQRGELKDFFYEKNKERYSNYANKIVHIKITDDMIGNLHPKLKKDKRGNIFDWRYENFQRDGITYGLSECKDDDIVIISDLDEIPNKRIIEEIKKNSLFYYNNINSCLLKAGPIVLECDMYMGYLNVKSSRKWLGSVITYKRHMSSPNEVREYRAILPSIKESGWHLSWMGGSRELIISKIKSLVEGERLTEEEIDIQVNNLIMGKGMPQNSYGCEMVSIDKIDIPFINTITDKRWFL